MLLRAVMETMKKLKSLIKWHLGFHSYHAEGKKYIRLHELLAIHLP